MKTRHGSRERPARGLLLIGLGAVLWAGCRDQSERAALAQMPSGDDARSVENATPSAGLPGVTVRRLATSEYRTFEFSSISPDGRYMSMVDWSTVDLAVRDLSTGELHRLTSAHREPGTPYEGSGGLSVFSPDGRHIAFPWQVTPDVQLRVLDFEPDETGRPRAAEPAVIFHNPQFEPYVPFDWSPDGEHILAKVWMAGEESHTHSTNHLALISTIDGTYQALESFDWREPLRAAFSPDGRYVAYDFLPEVDSPNRDLFVVSLDGTHEARVVDGPAIDRLLDWQPDGSILFHSDRNGTPGVWRVPMSEGRPAGPIALVKADMWGVQPLGSAPGRFYYGIVVEQPRLYTAGVDLGAGRMTGVPIALADPAQVQVRGWDWSPDGDHLAYSATTPGASGSVVGIRSLDGDDEQSMHLDLEATQQIRWHPDGGSLVLFGVDSKARRGFFRVDLESGSVSPILPADELDRSIFGGHFDLSPDGETLYFGVSASEPSSYALDLVSHHLETGAERYLATVQWPGLVAMAPDGARLAIVSPGSRWNGGWVGTIPAGGGDVTELYEIPPDTHVQAVEWTPDGRSLVFTTRAGGQDDVDETVLWSIPAEGGEAQRVQLVDPLDPRSPRLHPDGRSIAFMAGESRGEVWVMEGLGEPASTTAEMEDSR